MFLLPLPLVSMYCESIKEAYKNCASSSLNFHIQMTNKVLGCRNCPGGKVAIGQLTMHVTVKFCFEKTKVHSKKGVNNNCNWLIY